MNAFIEKKAKYIFKLFYKINITYFKFFVIILIYYLLLRLKLFKIVIC
jgi:hypothetical protein